MLKIKKGIASSDIEYGSSRILFVEGINGSLDEELLNQVFSTINVKGIGTCSNIKSAASAFADVHPTYFFVVDRDHQTDENIEKTWEAFEKKRGNLIIWRKKEIENYFLDPMLLSASEFLKGEITEADIREAIVSYAKEELYMCVTNRVIINLRENLKTNWIHKYTDPQKIPNKETALLTLKENAIIKEKLSEIVTMFSSIEDNFNRELRFLLGENEELRWGEGRWLDLMPGKNILHKLLNSTKLFVVTDSYGNQVTGKDRRKLILSRILKDESVWPDDFKKLKTLLDNRE